MSRYGHYGQPVRLHDEPKRAQLKEVMTTYELTSPIAAIFAYHGTILPLVARRAEAWIFVGVHVILLVLNDVAGLIDIDAFLGVDPLKTMGILTALLSFFIVYFTSQSLARFTTFYQSCTGISGSLQQIASQTSVHLADYPGRVPLHALRRVPRVHEGDGCREADNRCGRVAAAHAA